MRIEYDYSFVSIPSQKLLTHGYGVESLRSVSIRFSYTKKQKKQNEAFANMVGVESEAWKTYVLRAAKMRSAHMKVILDTITEEFVCYQYNDRNELQYMSSRWDLFLWCGTFDERRPDGLSGRDYSIFSLTFNDAHSLEEKQEIYDRLVQLLNKEFLSDPNLSVVVQYTAFRDSEKMSRDAEWVAPLLDCSYEQTEENAAFDDCVRCKNGEWTHVLRSVAYKILTMLSRPVKQLLE